MRPMPSNILPGETSTCALPSPLKRLDMPTSAIPICAGNDAYMDIYDPVTKALPIPVSTLLWIGLENLHAQLAMPWLAAASRLWRKALTGNMLVIVCQCKIWQ